MPNEHRVKKGECISSIAEKYGFRPETIWDSNENAELKSKRGQEPSILFAGDIVIIPDKRPKTESAATESKHRFLRKGVPDKIEIQFMIGDTPVSDEPYEIRINDVTKTGHTNSDGMLIEGIPPNAMQATIFLGEQRDQYNVKLGDLDPIDESAGIQARLKNLGFDCGPIDGVIGPKTTAAIKSFQKKHELEITGTPDEITRAKLKELHKC